MNFRQKKYYFNPVTLTYEEIKLKKSRKVFHLVSIIFVSLTLALTSGYALNYFFGSGESRFLEYQISLLNGEMKHLMQKGQHIGEKLHSEFIVKDNKYRTILQLDTLPASVRIAGSGGAAISGQLVSQDEISIKLNSMIHSLANQLQIQSGSFTELYKKATEYSTGQTHLPAIQPIAREDLTMISDDFGTRSDPFLMTARNHYGLDFVAPAGKNVYATGDGTVTFVQYSRTGYGNEIVIDHRFGFGSRYGHLQTITVKEGEQVRRGQIIGTVGQTGRATGPHLHYEVLYQHRPVNPSFYFDTSLTKEEFAQIINKAKITDN